VTFLCIFSTRGSLVVRVSFCVVYNLYNRQCLSSDDCLEDKMEDYKNCSVLYFVRQLCNQQIIMEGKGENYQVCSVQYCVQQLCTVRCTHI